MDKELYRGVQLIFLKSVCNQCGNKPGVLLMTPASPGPEFITPRPPIAYQFSGCSLHINVKLDWNSPGQIPVVNSLS